MTHPKLGASWEGFALEQTIAFFEAEIEECYFWGPSYLLILKDEEKLGFKFKYSGNISYFLEKNIHPKFVQLAS